MKWSVEQVRSHLLNSSINSAILAGSALFSVAIGFLIAAPLWALATGAPHIYSRICLAVLILVSLSLWLRKIIFLKKKSGISVLRKMLLFACRTLTLLLFICLISSLYWQFPLPAIGCGILLIFLRIPLFLYGDSV